MIPKSVRRAPDVAPTSRPDTSGDRLPAGGGGSADASGARARVTLEWLTVCGPASYLTLLGAGVLYYHPHPLPPFWPAFVVLLTLSSIGTFVFSRFVFAHVRRQEGEIVRRTRDLADVQEAMAVVTERQRIGRELHDSLAQHLGYLHLRLADVEQRLAADVAHGVRDDIGELKQAAREAYEEARQAIFGLRSMVSRSLGFIPTLTEYLHDWSRQAGVVVDLAAAPEEATTFPPVMEVQLIGIIQEALANVRKHSRARRVVVSVERAGKLTTVAISDDGVGFDRTARAAEGRDSFGLDTMRERAEAIGGRLLVRSRPGAGTSVEVRFGGDDRRRDEP